MNVHAELENLLSETIASAIEREQFSFDRRSSTLSSSLVLFGAGGLGRKTLAGLRQIGIEPMAFVDNNESLWSDRVEDVPVYSPQAAARQFGKCAVFIVTIWHAGGSHRFEQTRQQLLDLGCSEVVSFAFLFWKYPHVFLPYYAIGLPHLLLQQAQEIAHIFSIWADEASRCEYVAQVRWRLLLDFDGLPSPVIHDQYFPDDLFCLNEREVFVDCGAYDGDSLRIFFQRQPFFKGKFIAIEPDPHNLKSLRKCIETLPDNLQECVTVMPVALGEHRETVSFAATGLPSAGISSAGSHEVESIPLNEILGNMAPSFIKMDIEGAELDALIGARHCIEENRPVLAISVYHQPDHLWRIPLLIQSFSDQYRFFLRSHNEEGWDLVCYAVPVSRLNKKVNRAVQP